MNSLGTDKAASVESILLKKRWINNIMLSSIYKWSQQTRVATYSAFFSNFLQQDDAVLIA